METPTHEGGVEVSNVDTAALALLERRANRPQPEPEVIVEEEQEPAEVTEEDTPQEVEATEDDGMQGEADDDDAIQEESETFKSVSELAEATGLSEEDFLSQINLTTKVNGEVTEVSLADLKKGYQLESDYTRKNKAFIEQQKAFEEQRVKAQEELKHEFERTGHAFRLAQEQLTHEFNAINWQELERDNPSDYMLKRQKFGERQAQIDHAIKQATNQAQAFMSKQAETQQVETEKYLKQQDELLLSALPSWNDATVRKAESGKVAEFLVDSGFKPDEVAEIKDHRIILLAQKAMGAGEMQTKADLAKKKVKKAPKLVKGNARQTSNQSNARRITELTKRAVKTGRPADIAAALLSRRRK